MTQTETETDVVADKDSITDTLTSIIEKTWKTTVNIFKGDRLGQIGIFILIAMFFLATFGPVLAPYDPGEVNRGEGGDVLRLEGPSSDHYFGTTNMGRDVFSQVLVSARVSLFVGVVAAFIAVFIGTNVGLLAGYLGGWTDDVLMRICDLAYGVPFLPFIIVLVAVAGQGLQTIILAIGFLLWRTTSRVIRSQVLSHKQRPYVESAKAAGASDFRIMYRHILPNVLPLAFLYAAFSVGWAVIGEASISFLGYGDPTLFTWGQMINEAYGFGAMRQAWWWVVPPGLMVMFLVMAVFFIGRTLEKWTNPELKHRE